MTTPSPTVHVLVPAFRGGASLHGCLESVLASVGVRPVVVVMDDASGDGSADAVRERFPDVEVIEQPENAGFARNCNRGFELLIERGAEAVLLLNQDTRVAPDTLARLREFLGAHPAAGAVGPKTYSTSRAADGGERLLYAGAWRCRLPLRQTIPGIEQVEREPRIDPVRVDYVWGHGVYLRAEVLREVGLFDPSFPMYYEDLDLCRRIEEAGYELWCEPRAVMWHDVVDGARAVDSEFWRWVQKTRGTSVFHRKHYGGAAAACLTPLTILSEILQLLRGGRSRAAMHLSLAGLKHAVAWRPWNTQREAVR